MTYKASCPQCGVVAARQRNEKDWQDGAAWTCSCGEQFDTVECRVCHRMVTSTWYGVCGPHGCETPPPSPEQIADALHNLERILQS